MLIKSIVSFFTSLKLTVTLLTFAIVLVFVGTLAQVDEGLYAAQSHYFRQWFVLGLHLGGRQIPFILPGGYLIGTLLLVNLVAAHIYRFEFSVKKIGIQLAHAGVILLLVGQLVTDMLAREMQLHFFEGEAKDYSESAMDYELSFRNGTQVTAFLTGSLRAGDELKDDSLPFVIRILDYWKNSDVNFRAPMMAKTPPLTTNGVALSFDFRQVEAVKTMDQRNIPSALIELTGPKGSLGSWVVSDWIGDPALAGSVQNSYAQQLGPEMAHSVASKLVAPQFVEVDGRQYTFTLRPARVMHPFSLTLLKATHTVYPGTDIPKDFRSRVQVKNSKTGENREVEISMNHPLRYGGLTFYQYQMSAGEVVERAGETPSSVLSVVRNPGWLTPYIGCAMVGIGLMIQFTYHLVGFISKRKTK